MALTIGIAIILPLTYLTLKTEATTQSNDKPWFNIDVSAACFNVDITDDDSTELEILVFNALTNFDALSQQIAARVEYFEFTFYTNDMQLSKSYNYVGMDKPGTENPTTFPTLPEESWYTIPWLSFNAKGSSGIYSWNVTSLEALQEMENSRTTSGGTSSLRTGRTYEEISTTLAALENTQTIYLDVKRVACITLDDNGTVTTSECDQLIHHIELTKNSNGEFTFGDLTVLKERAYQLNQSKATPKNATSTTSILE